MVPNSSRSRSPGALELFLKVLMRRGAWSRPSFLSKERRCWPRTSWTSTGSTGTARTWPSLLRGVFFLLPPSNFPRCALLVFASGLYSATHRLQHDHAHGLLRDDVRRGPQGRHPVWKSTSASGAPDNSSLSHFSAMTCSSWLGRAVRNRHRHAIEQASRRWRGGGRDDSARTRRKILISTGATEGTFGMFSSPMTGEEFLKKINA